ncbi:hypothetical protein RhiJN_06394 [Ceratobasidium sp. AG-Ba]|nr:hypothetical protein RhiJN_06394 [Ceratobasidium sp. AG-Ba]
MQNLSFPSGHNRDTSQRHPVPQSGQVLLVTDTPASSAQFIVQALLQSQLKRESDTAGRGCILVSVDDDLAHISAIASRSNLNLQNHLRARSLVYVDGSQLTLSHTTTAQPGVIVCPLIDTSLRPLYDVIECAFNDLAPTAAERLLVLGDISTLEWIDIPLVEIMRFVRAVRALAVRHEAGLVITYHSPTPTLPLESDVLRDLVMSCDIHVEVRELSSGLSSAVSGEVALHPGYTYPDPHLVPIPRERAIQYRLTDNGAVWFERGTSAGVL